MIWYDYLWHFIACWSHTQLKNIRGLSWNTEKLGLPLGAKLTKWRKPQKSPKMVCEDRNTFGVAYFWTDADGDVRMGPFWSVVVSRKNWSKI